MKSARIARRGLIGLCGLALILGLGMIHGSALAAKKDVSPVWDAKVQPIFAQYCVGCHGPETQMAGLRLDDAAAALKGGLNGPVIIAEQSLESRLVQRVSLPRTDARVMPPNGNPLPTEEQIRVLVEWIDGGALLPASEVESLSEAEEAPQPVPYSVLSGPAGELTFDEKIHPSFATIVMTATARRAARAGSPLRTTPNNGLARTCVPGISSGGRLRVRSPPVRCLIQGRSGSLPKKNGSCSACGSTRNWSRASRPTRPGQATRDCGK